MWESCHLSCLTDCWETSDRQITAEVAWYRPAIVILDSYVPLFQIPRENIFSTLHSLSHPGANTAVKRLTKVCLVWHKILYSSSTNILCSLLKSRHWKVYSLSLSLSLSRTHTHTLIISLLLMNDLPTFTLILLHNHWIYTYCC